jgi:peptidylprolyl isomerase
MRKSLVLFAMLSSVSALIVPRMTANAPTSIRAKSMETVKVLLTSASITTASVLLTRPQFSLADEGVDVSKYTTTESGLKYFDIKEGTGAVPKPGDLVRVHYTGWLDGFESEKKFDSSYDRRSPLSFPVGTKRVIAGWDEGILTNLKVGGKRNLIIPPDLGYGPRGAGGVIPPNAVLYFTIELVGIGAR